MVKQVSVKAATPKQVIEWVQLMNAIPANKNLLNDPDGDFAEKGDVGKTHYLAGTMSDVPQQREFQVDLGDTLVLPMINAWEWIPGDHDNLKDAARSFFDSANPQNAWLKIDLNNDSTNEFELKLDLKDSTYFPDLHIEKENRKFYVESKKDFVFYNPEDNINGIEEGRYDSYSVGYYARIDKLVEGTHKIQFGGAFDLALQLRLPDAVA